jgi:hypothetical protein
MDFEGNPGNKPVVAMDICDVPPDDWPETLSKPLADVLMTRHNGLKNVLSSMGRI